MTNQARMAPRKYCAAGSAALLTIAALLTACSSSVKSTGAPAAGNTAAINSPASNTSASDTASGSGNSAASSGSGSASAPSTSSAPPVDASGSGSFCDEAKREQKEENDSADAFTSGNTDSLKAIIARGAAELPVFVAKAPASIKPSVQVIADTEKKLYAQLQASNYSLSELSTAAASLNTPAFAQASAAVESYLSKTCGIDVGDTPSS